MTAFKAGVKNANGPKADKGARDPANFGKKEAQQRVSKAVDTGAKAPTKFMKKK
ncbi:hypothetical protein [Caudoviricetes sp.]|nr:hypothetical protein [Caudoviricetes sp.]